MSTPAGTYWLSIDLNMWHEQVWREIDQFWYEEPYFRLYFYESRFGRGFDQKPWYELSHAMNALCLSRLGRKYCTLDFGMNPEW